MLFLNRFKISKFKSGYIGLVFLSLTLAGVLKANPVLYSLDIYNPVNNSPIYSFEYLAPSYITNFAVVSAAQLTDLVVPQGYSLYNVTLSQGTIPYPIVVVNFVLEATDGSGETSNSYQLSRGPNQPGVYLDRDGSYTLFATDQYGYSGPANFSVAQTPEPAAWSLVICAFSIGLLQKMKSKSKA